MRSLLRRSGRSVPIALLALLSLVTATCALAQGGEPQYFAIRGAKVVPVSGPPLENATVVIGRGVIIAVAADAAIPADAWVVEGKGLVVYPGLVDSFTDVGIAPTAPAAPAEGGPRRGGEVARGPEDRPQTTIWRKAADEASLADKRIETWRSAGFTTVVSAPKGGFFPGQAAVLDLAGERNGDLVVKSPVAIPVVMRATGGFASGFPDSLMGVIGYEHQFLLDTDWLARANAAYDKNPKGTARPRYDRASAALSDALQDHAFFLIASNTALDMRRVLAIAERWKISAAIFGGQAGYEIADEIAARKTPVIIDLKWPEAEKDADPDDQPSLRTLRFRDRAPSTPAAFVKAGVKFSFASGAQSDPKALLKAVKKSIDAGLAPDAALRALTLSPAEIFGVADRLGSIEKGKIANLVVADGDLFNEKTKIKLVFVDGHRFTIHEPEKPKDAPKGDISGKWKLAYTTPEGSEESVADLVMAGDGSISGTVSGKRGVGTIISGYLSADKFNFVINMPVEGSFADVTFSGTFDGSTLKGNIAVLGYSLDFTGTKSAPTSSLAARSAANLAGQGDAQ